ncbi:MAG: 2-succinyl-5-enolpyruvyl-6-hydroxy-3-cyclohexene-1-carboxylic-acid synthase [Acidimicrobiales bacterium]
MSVSLHTAGAGPSDIQMAFAATLVDEWVRGGVSHAVICTGSRSTPMAVALMADGGMKIHVRLDERSAGFTALGIGMSSGCPPILLTTSGTAAAELHAAAVEADLAGIPLLVCTADRPPELRDVGAPQAIDQQQLFGRAVRWFTDPGVPERGTRSAWRSLASRALAEAVSGPRGPGPVHLNLPFREPLLGRISAEEIPPGRPGGQPWHRVDVEITPPSSASVHAILAAGLEGRRGVIIAGAGCGDPDVVAAASEALRWPVLADPRSGLRRPGSTLIAMADGILRSDTFAGRHRAEFVLKLGAPWASKIVAGYAVAAARANSPVMVVAPDARWVDPDGSAAVVVRADPTAVCHEIVEGMRRAVANGQGPREPSSDSTWLEDWQRAQVAADGAVEAALAASGCGGGSDALHGWTEPMLARHLFACLPDGATLVTSSSMPIRDIEAFAAPRTNPPRVVANRGANGIDGVVSTALGVALATGPTVALVGDLAFLHDVSALVRGPGPEIPCTVVVADNHGGGIFSFLPAVTGLDAVSFETLFGTPQASNVADVASGFGIPVDEIGPGDGPAALRERLRCRMKGGAMAVIRVQLPSRSENAEIHAILDRAVVDAVDMVVAGR